MSQELLQRVDSFLWQPRPNYMPPQLKSVVVLEHCGGVRHPQAMLRATDAVLDSRHSRAPTPRGDVRQLHAPFAPDAPVDVVGAGSSAVATAVARAHALVATAFLTAGSDVEVRSAEAVRNAMTGYGSATLPIGASVGAEGLVVIPTDAGGGAGTAVASGNVDPQLVFSHAHALRVKLEQGGGQWGARSPSLGEVCAACGLGTEQRLATMTSTYPANACCCYMRLCEGRACLSACVRVLCVSELELRSASHLHPHPPCGRPRRR